MAENQGLSYTSAEVDEIMSDLSVFADANIAQSISTTKDWENLTEMKRNRIRTILHGTILKEYLSNSMAPKGLLVSNAPRIFLEDEAFRKDWAAIAWHCTHDWIVLILKTALRLSEKIQVEIQVTESHMKTTITGFKKKLDELNKEMTDYKDNLTQQKVQKFHKDLKRFSYTKAYPYSDPEFTPQSKEEDTSDASSNASSNTSNSSINSGGSNSKPRGRGRGRGQGNWSHYAPVPMQGPPDPYYHPQNMPMYGWQPPFQQPFFQPNPYTPPFLYRGGRGRGKRRNQNQGAQVHWAAEDPSANQNKPRPQQAGPSNRRT